MRKFVLLAFLVCGTVSAGEVKIVNGGDSNPRFAILPDTYEPIRLYKNANGELKDIKGFVHVKNITRDRISSGYVGIEYTIKDMDGAPLVDGELHVSKDLEPGQQHSCYITKTLKEALADPRISSKDRRRFPATFEWKDTGKK